MLRHQPPIRGKQVRKDERGASLVEYALLLALIAVVVFSAVSFFGSSTGGGFSKSSECIRAAYAAEDPCE